MRKLREHAEIERGLAAIFGKSRMLTTNTGASPAPYDAIPDYSDIWYQPDDDPRREDEAESRENRREAMGIANRGKYGFHGTADSGDEPMLRYEMDDFPQNSPRRNPSPNVRREAIVTPNKYPQPTPTGPVPKAPRLVVPADKMQGKYGSGGASSAKVVTPQRRPKMNEGGGHNFVADKQLPHQRAATTQPKKPIPTVTKQKFASAPSAVQRTESAARPRTAPRPPAYTRMGS